MWNLPKINQPKVDHREISYDIIRRHYHDDDSPEKARYYFLMAEEAHCNLWFTYYSDDLYVLARIVPLDWTDEEYLDYTRGIADFVADYDKHGWFIYIASGSVTRLLEVMPRPLKYVIWDDGRKIRRCLISRFRKLTQHKSWPKENNQRCPNPHLPLPVHHENPSLSADKPKRTMTSNVAGE
jgi:hypothetical protein